MRTRPDPDLVQRAADAITQASRPVIVAGGGVLTSRAWDELTALAETLNIPVATSINGKGSVAETSPVSIGIVGGNGARSYTNAVVANADLVIFIGTRTDSTTTDHWRVPPIHGSVAAIQIDVEPFEIGNNYRLVAPVAGDGLRSRISLTAIEHPSAIANKHRERIDALVAERDRYWPISSNRREAPIVRSNRNGLCKRCEKCSTMTLSLLPIRARRLPISARNTNYDARVGLPSFRAPTAD